MRISITENSQSIILKGPCIIEANPFVGHLKIALEYSVNQGICFHLQKKRITHVSSNDEIPEDTYLGIFKGKNYFRIFLCLSHQDLIASLGVGGSLNLVSGQSKPANRVRSVLVIEEGKTIYEAIQRVFRLAIQETGQFGKRLEEKPPLPNFFNYLGWRSQTAQGQSKRISHANILQDMRRLKNQGFSIQYVLLDEGWQQLHEGKLGSFEADKSAFPQGIQGVVEDLKFEGIEHVGVCHAMMGHQNGLSDHYAKFYGFPPDHRSRYFPGYDLGKTFQFFYDYYEALKTKGISFVSVGDQESTSLYCRKGMDSTSLYKNLQTAIQAASTLHFQTAQLNSNCLRSENLFYWTSSRAAHSNPLVTDNEAEQIHSTLCHSLWLQELMQPHSGLGNTKGEIGLIFHALSDSYHMIDGPEANHLIHEMALPSGKILSPDYPLTICEESLFSNPLQTPSLYKAFTKKEGHGILTVFNFFSENRRIKGEVSPKEIRDLEGEKFVLYSRRQGVLGEIEREKKLPIKLQSQSVDVFTFAPIQKGIGVIGCHSYILTMGPIDNSYLEEDTLHIFSQVAAPILIYSERKIFDVRRDGLPVRWAYNPQRKLLSIEDGRKISETISRYMIVFE